MPCSIYEGAQRRLCFATRKWQDWSKIKLKKISKKNIKIKKNERRKKEVR